MQRFLPGRRTENNMITSMESARRPMPVRRVSMLVQTHCLKESATLRRLPEQQVRRSQRAPANCHRQWGVRD